jgi:L-alanine-DL-glutamate epimerase-like enolase superfamily enzyme
MDDLPDHVLENRRNWTEYAPFFCEEPVPPENVDALRQVREAVRVPIATGERMVGVASFRELFEKRADSVIQPDITHCGGLSEARRIAAMLASDGALGIGAARDAADAAGDFLRPIFFHLRVHKAAQLHGAFECFHFHHRVFVLGVVSQRALHPHRSRLVVDVFAGALAIAVACTSAETHGRCRSKRRGCA